MRDSNEDTLLLFTDDEGDPLNVGGPTGNSISLPEGSPTLSTLIGQASSSAGQASTLSYDIVNSVADASTNGTGPTEAQLAVAKELSAIATSLKNLAALYQAANC